MFERDASVYFWPFEQRFRSSTIKLKLNPYLTVCFNSAFIGAQIAPPQPAGGCRKNKQSFRVFLTFIAKSFPFSGQISNHLSPVMPSGQNSNGFKPTELQLQQQRHVSDWTRLKSSTQTRQRLIISTVPDRLSSAEKHTSFCRRALGPASPHRHQMKG